LVRVIEDAKVSGQKRKMALDLFSGTGSVAKVLGEWSHEVITVDLKSKRNPKVCVDIMFWDYKKYSTGFSDLMAYKCTPQFVEYKVSTFELNLLH